MSTQSDQLYNTQLFNIKEVVEAKEFSGNNIQNSNEIDSILLNKIKNKIGNKCNNIGYVDKDSIRIISRSMGKINSSQFNGNINYDIKVEANICKPGINNKLVCEIIGKNKIGLFAISDPLHIIIATAHHDNIADLSELEPGTSIEVEIINYKFKLNASNIKVIARYIKTV